MISDIDAYIRRYRGATIISRLEFVYKRLPEVEDRRAVATALMSYLKSIKNTVEYKKWHERLEVSGEMSLLEPKSELETWIYSTDAENKREQTSLQSEVQSAKVNGVKDNIRIAYENLAKFECNCGNLDEAMKCHIRIREYCMTPAQNFDAHMEALATAVVQGNWPKASQYCSRLENDYAGLSAVSAAGALIDIHDRHYDRAASKLRDVRASEAVDFNALYSAHDAAMYCIFTNLATSSRSTIRQTMVDCKIGNVKEYYEVIPELRNIVQHYIDGRFDAVFTELSAMVPTLSLDIHFSEHVESLLIQIRDRCVLEYFEPYECVKMSKMATALGVSMDEVHDITIHMITTGQLPARIDAQSQTLHRRKLDDYRATMDAVLRVTEKQEKEMIANYMRLSMIKKGFIATDNTLTDKYERNAKVFVQPLPELDHHQDIDRIKERHRKREKHGDIEGMSSGED
jgi:COP9 signalosome complex subunit 1